MGIQSSLAHYLAGFGVSAWRANAAAVRILSKIEKRRGLNGAEATVFSAYANDSKAPAVPQSILMALTAAKTQSRSKSVAIKWTSQPTPNGIGSVEWTYPGSGYTATDDLWTFTLSPTPDHIRKAILSFNPSSQPSGI